MRYAVGFVSDTGGMSLNWQGWLVLVGCDSLKMREEVNSLGPPPSSSTFEVRVQRKPSINERLVASIVQTIGVCDTGWWDRLRSTGQEYASAT